MAHLHTRMQKIRGDELDVERPRTYGYGGCLRWVSIAIFNSTHDAAVVCYPREEGRGRGEVHSIISFLYIRDIKSNHRCQIVGSVIPANDSRKGRRVGNWNEARVNDN